MTSHEPIFRVPGVVMLLLGVFVTVHVVLRMVPDEQTYVDWLLALAFIPARYTGAMDGLPGGALAAFTSPFTHQLVHVDVVHLAMNGAWLLAFGAVLCRRLGTARFLLFSACGGLAGAALMFAIHPSLVAPMIGASGAISAMMGAVMRFLFTAIDGRDGAVLRENPRAVRAMSLAEAVSHPRILAVSAVFLLINILAVVGFGSFDTGATIAWEAHIGGYLFGLLAFGLFDVAPQYAAYPTQDSE